MATPFKGQVTFRLMNGMVAVEPFTASDVADAYIVFTNSGNTFYDMPEAGMLTDVALSAAGVTTTKLNLKARGKDSGITLLGSGLVTTINNRIPSPIKIAKGTMIQVQQKA